ncbi:MAG: SDR family NAD(P)-dependent oxidoreductase [Micrococcaceae bacterium]
MSLTPNVDSLPRASKGELPGRGRLQGRRVLVVGGGQRVFDAETDPIGNGRAMSILYSREGADVVVVDANLDSAQVTVDAIRANGGNATALQADVSDPEAVPGMIAQTTQILGGLDAMVYNVGIGIGDLDFAGVDLSAWDRTFDVNVRGAMLTLREALPVMSEGGSIVLISTTAAVRSSSRLVAYEVSKSALMGLMRHAAREAATRGVRVNMVFPGLVDTPNGRTAGAGRPDRAASNVPLGRMATGWDIAYATLFFMGDESSHVTAQTLAVDGGRTGI